MLEYVGHFMSVLEIMKKIKTKSLGLFPLSMVILPKESVRLHIFESQFKALINDCFANGKDFVVPFVHNGRTTSIGCCVKLVDVERFYPDGKMDIKVEGQSVVKIHQTVNSRQIPYQLGEIEGIESGLPQIHSKEIQSLFAKYCDFTGKSVSKDLQIDLFEVANNIPLDATIKTQILKHSDNPMIQSKIIVNELRMLVLTLQLQNKSGFRYYMN